MKNHSTLQSLTDIETQIKLACFFWVGATFIMFLLTPPYWALMDDGWNLQFAVNGFDHKNIFEFTYYFTKEILIAKLGRFQPVYPFYLYAFYGTFLKSPALAYLSLFWVNITIFFAWSYLFYLTCQSIPAKRKTEAISARLMGWLYFLFLFLWPPNYNLFFFASIQERLILLCASISYFGMIDLNRKQGVTWWSGACVVFGIAFALLSKETALFMIPPICLWLFMLAIRTRKWSFFALSLFIGMTSLVFGCLFLKIRASFYSSLYRISGIASTFLSPNPYLHIPLLIAIVTLVLLLRSRLYKNSNGDRSLPFYVWPFSLICYLLILLPWGNFRSYFATISGFFLVATILIAYQAVVAVSGRRRIFSNILILGILAASAIGISKFNYELRQHHGTSRVVKFMRETYEADPNFHAWLPGSLPCYEASILLNGYAGLDNKIIWLNQAEFKDSLFSLTTNGKQFVILNKECPNLPRDFSVRKIVFQYQPWFVYEGVFSLPHERNAS